MSLCLLSAMVGAKFVVLTFDYVIEKGKNGILMSFVVT